VGIKVFTERDHFFMQAAIKMAEKARDENEVPVGAVLVSNDEIIAEGWNRPIGNCDPSAHAEIVALRKGAHILKNYRLIDTTLYVTLEPCLMCVGAICHARVRRVVFGAEDLRAGAVVSAFPLRETKKLNYHVVYQGGLLKEICATLLTSFFQMRRA